jgi:hypothetical protein
MSPRYDLGYQLVSGLRSHAYMTGISTGKSHLYCSRCPPSGVYLFIFSSADRNAITSQAAKNVGASEDALFEVFEHLEAFFRRLEIYTEAALDPRMVDIVAKIMAEVLNILGITTNEIKQSRMSKRLLYGCMAADRTIFREISKEAVKKYG